MNDLERQIAELRASNRRWKLAAVTLCVLLGVPLLFVPVALHFRAQQARMQAEAARDRAEYARGLAAEQAARAARQAAEQGNKRPTADEKPKD
jgi:hypothetical protein